MTIDLTDQERSALVQALNAVGVTGAESMRMVLALLDKLTKAGTA